MMAKNTFFVIRRGSVVNQTRQSMHDSRIGRLLVYHVWIERMSVHVCVWIERMCVHRDGIERMPCTGVWIERQLVHIVG